MGHPDALLECVTLLADPEIAARTGAIRAIADAGRPEGVLLLRLKTLLGDKEIEVTGECFASLLSLDPARSVEFVAQVPEFQRGGNRRTGRAGAGRIAAGGGVRGVARRLGTGWPGGAAADAAGCDRDAQNRRSAGVPVEPFRGRKRPRSRRCAGRPGVLCTRRSRAGTRGRHHPRARRRRAGGRFRSRIRPSVVTVPLFPDISGQDIRAHAGEPERAIREVRDWLSTPCSDANFLSALIRVHLWPLRLHRTNCWPPINTDERRY